MRALPRALLIEDNQDDALLVERQLRASGVPLLTERVDSDRTLRRALLAGSWDLVLCDFDLPGFSGLQALEVVRDFDPDLPFIFVSGTIGEEAAVSAMRAGAHDYVLKHNLHRLAPAVERELREAQARRERAQTRAELRRSELRFQRVFESNVVGIALWNDDGRIVDANESFLQMVGFSRQDLILGTLDWQSVTPAAYAELDALAAVSIRATGSCPPYKKEFVHSSGCRVPVLISASRLDDAEHAGVAVLVDISAERRAERERTEAHSLIAAMVDSTPLPMMVLDAAGRVSLWNPAAAALFGWSADEVLGHSLPWSATTLDGAAVPMAMLDTLGATAWAEEVAITDRAGASLVVELHLSPIRDADGASNGTALVARDLTQSRKLEAKLMQSQKMEVMGNFASGIAHDFNNLLSIIAFSLELALDDEADRSQTKADLRTAQDAAHRGAGLTRQLLNFSKPKVVAHSAVNLASVVRDTGCMLERLIGNPKIRLVVPDLPAELWVKADRGQLEQILLNLAINARDAMPNGGTLTLSASPSGDLIRPMAECVVRDTGVGIPHDITEKVFEPFFTTKESGLGTGLGLSTVRDLVQQHGGTIQIESTVQVGTAVLLRFPLLLQERAKSGTERRAASPAESATVLVVDDEPLILHIAARLIGRLGHSVTTAPSGHEALALFQEASFRPQLVISDLNMPGMRGDELASHLRAIDPAIHLLFVSAAESTPDIDDLIDQGVAEFLSKPYREQDLSNAVARLLRSSPHTTPNTVRETKDPEAPQS